MGNNPPETIEAPESPAEPATSVTVRARALRLESDERRGGGRFRWWRLFLWLILLGALGGATFGYVTVYAPANFPEVETYLFSTKIAQETLLDLSGFIVPRLKINVAADVGGNIVKVCVEEGMKVRKGDLLIQIDDDRYRAELEQAKAGLIYAQLQLEELRNGTRPEEIEQAEASLEQAVAHLDLTRKDLERAIRLDRGAVSISKSDYDKYLSAYQEAEATVRNLRLALRLAKIGPRAERIKAAEAEVERQKANFGRAQYFVDRTRIVAPADGTILERKTEVGESVHPEVVSPALCVMADLSRLEADVSVQERDLNLLGKCGRCQIIPDAYSDRVYEGKVARLQPMVNRQRGVVQVKVTVLDPDDMLLPDMNCRVLFLKDATKPATDELPRIPERALVKEDEECVVFVLDGKTARRRTIEVGKTIGEAVEVVKGLENGEVVLLPGAQHLADGQTIRPKLPSRDDRVLRRE
jgi:HlyD family secretion protein